MLIGLDFDNTIVCYDRLFHRLAVERDLVPPGLPQTKQAVRDFLRATSREDDWTELQGIAYGPRIADAEPFPGIIPFLSSCRAKRARVVIVSHKTRYPYRGKKHDLHVAAHAFLKLNGLYKVSNTGLSPDRVFLEPTLAAKLARVRLLECTAFVDDLPEVLTHSAFPSEVRKVLFDPGGAYRDDPGYARVHSWIACADTLLSQREVFA